MVSTKSQKHDSPIITPKDFFTKEKEKTKLNWFLFEFALEIESHIKRLLRKKLNRKKINDRKIADFCIFYSKEMKPEILKKLAGKTEKVSLSYHAIEEL